MEDVSGMDGPCVLEIPVCHQNLPMPTRRLHLRPRGIDALPQSHPHLAIPVPNFLLLCPFPYSPASAVINEFLAGWTPLGGPVGIGLRWFIRMIEAGIECVQRTPGRGRGIVSRSPRRQAYRYPMAPRRRPRVTDAGGSGIAMSRAQERPTADADE
jgi:hypothetical protein